MNEQEKKVQACGNRPTPSNEEINNHDLLQIDDNTDTVLIQECYSGDFKVFCCIPESGLGSVINAGKNANKCFSVFPSIYANNILKSKGFFDDIGDVGRDTDVEGEVIVTIRFKRKEQA